MALLDLTYGQERYVRDMMVRENPAIIDVPLEHFKPLGDVIAQPDGSAAVYLLGDPADVDLQQATGKVYFHYQRIDLQAFLKNSKPLFATNPVNTHQLLVHLRKQVGIVLNPDDVHNDPLGGEAVGTATIRLKTPLNRCYALISNEFQVSWDASPYVELTDIFPDSNLEGFELLMPYLVPLDDVFAVTRLAGFTDPALVQNWDKLSSNWVIPNTEYALIDHLYDRVAAGAYDATKIAQAVNKASKERHGTFVCDNTAARPNLWSGQIISNLANTNWVGLKKPHRELKFRPIAEPSGGEGTMSIFYELIDFNAEQFVLPDSETALRTWLNGLPVPATTWDTTKAPQLFNAITKQKFGPWIAQNSSVVVRNMWWSGLTKREVVDVTIDGVKYNRKVTWSLAHANYSRTSLGDTVFYYNA